MSPSTGAPSWVSYGGLTIASLALLTALGALRISYLAYRAGGARGAAQITGPMRINPGKYAKVTMTVINRGRGETSIVGFHLVPYGERKPVVPLTAIEGPELPSRLSGSSQETFVIDVLPAFREYSKKLRSGALKPKSSWPDAVYLCAEMGDGRVVRSATQYGVNQILAQAGAFAD
jgi:hypothetical protein